MALAYGAAGDPAAGFARRVSFLIDEEGMVQKTYAPVNPGTHPDEVLRDLDAIGTAGGTGHGPGPGPR
jgi:peroxiredoxin